MIRVDIEQQEGGRAEGISSRYRAVATVRNRTFELTSSQPLLDMSRAILRSGLVIKTAKIGLFRKGREQPDIWANEIGLAAKLEAMDGRFRLLRKRTKGRK